MRQCKFDDIRPYYDEEINAAMNRIAESEYFPLLASYVYPGIDIEEVRKKLCSFSTISDFQLEVMKCVNEQVIKRSTTAFEYSGIEHLDPAKKYLFVSNHRDIMLDSSLLQYILYKNGHQTSEITFGANLMSSPLIIDIGKSNKMFKVERGGNMKEFYKSSLHLSEYIRYVITEKGESVWIAQRNGRTKDGDDSTDQGIVKMFCMSRPDDKIAAIEELHIVPVTVSYEWEPCDIFKALELYASRSGKYEKKPGEDLNSILAGIMQQKGRVRFSFGKEIVREDLLPFEADSSNLYHKNVASLLDKRIISNYLLWPNNYIAYDILNGEPVFASEYTKEQKADFTAHIAQLQKYAVQEPEALENILLGIYANPVKNAMALQEEKM